MTPLDQSSNDLAAFFKDYPWPSHPMDQYDWQRELHARYCSVFRDAARANKELAVNMRVYFEGSLEDIASELDGCALRYEQDEYDRAQDAKRKPAPVRD